MPEDIVDILVVDDRDDKRLAIEAIIGDLGQNIVMAKSGREALGFLLQQDFAIILLDVNMPGMDGFETAFLIRQRKSLEHVPIIFITAVSDTESQLSQGYSLGAVDYIFAPLVPDVLRTKVSVFVKLFKATQQVKRQAESLRSARDELEIRVNQRTKDLAIANAALQEEIAERLKAEAKVGRLNAQLEQRILDRTAELRTANEELETFTYSIAHDLRAPLRQIHGFSQVLEKELASCPVPETARKYLTRIGQRGQMMGQMVDELLKLSHINRQEVEFRETHLTTIVSEILSGIKLETRNRNIEWKIGDLPSVRCSPTLVRQVFENLISNAVKYSRPRNPAIIEIGMEKSVDRVILFVRDNGVGFDMKYANKLFRAFHRLHNPADFEGTGVGLAVVERIVHKHGGSTWAEGKENQGATFYFTLSA